MKRLYEASSPALLANTWGAYRAKVVAPECGAELSWAAWSLSDEDEEELPAAEMTALNDELAAVEAGLTDTEMSPYLKEFIAQQVETIRTALRVYPIRGAKPLQDALKQVAGGYAIDRGRLEQEQAVAPAPAKTLLSKTAGVVEKAAKVCDNLDKIKKFGGDAWTIAQGVGAIVLPYASKMTSSQ